ncbi:PTS system mannose/fructose/sorbose family transporter subunit IID [Pectinatus frisingensis]|uniref:PTS system mannose/fructose/sorbose family transporter subunit IID n=1 Tax=Pectinatus frisingensis TaxID=865 RepID=UPI001E2C9F2C|nr:PTS system mannose/fructose/sorbose family transporter subunit IID [Pectinatus frisingensis]
MDNQNMNKKITKFDLVRAYWMWNFFSHANYNYERLQATGFVQHLAPIIKKLYGDRPDEYKECIKRHMQFFNTEPYFGGVINGLVIAMEEDKANGAPITGDMISSIKTGLMGPFAGVGDTIWQGTLNPIFLAFGVTLASSGNLFGPAIYAVLMLLSLWGLGYFMFMRGYKLGKIGIQELMQGNLLNRILVAASCMGAITLGALSANFVKLSAPVVINIGESSINVQQKILDTLMPQLLSLILVLGTYWLLKKKRMSATKSMIILVVIAIIGGLLGIF